MNAYCAILAGGSGSRMGSGIPKQFLMLKDAPIIIHTLRRVLSFNLFKMIIVAVHSDWEKYLCSLLDEYQIDKGLLIVTKGGKDRVDSIRNTLSALRLKADAVDADIVVVHDAVRPFVGRDVMVRSIDAASEYGACVATIPATDTILCIDDGLVVAVPPRNRLFHGQAPDSAQLCLLEKALGSLSAAEQETITGTAHILVEKGVRVRSISGDVRNIKITTPSDMELAERFMV